MASLRPRRPLLKSSPTHLQLFFQLPPTYRSFHASPAPRFLDATLGVTQTVLEGLHSTTGLSWAYTIPLSAALLRLTVILPISIYLRRTQQQQVALTPLLSAWQHIIRRETMAEVGHLGPTVAQSTALKKMRAKRQEIFRRFDCQAWKGLVPPFIQLPFWLIMIETVRRMCGSQVGLLGMAVSRISGTEEATAASTAIEQGLHRIESLATEGMLWFPNLLLPDPQLVLPFMLSGLILLNMSGKGNVNAALWQTRLSRGLKIGALAIGPLTLHVPSAILVYWISSTGLGLMQSKALSVFMPLQPPVAPCVEKPSRFVLAARATARADADRKASVKS
ncbi:hypothetical protein PVAG01_06971 [Phlyctema vagabunda]|uniref:Uncharacterized protein n=1 Tax=Phlyctema vagabunda TaxID=108571 RepID=A0ABR4PB26_9HELO